MFAAIAAESGCRPRDITAMAAALPGRGELLSRGDPAHAVWIDDSGAFAAACRGLPWLPEDPLDIQPAVDLELIGCREWLSKPSVRQWMPAPQAFGEIVERDHIGATTRRQ